MKIRSHSDLLRDPPQHGTSYSYLERAAAPFLLFSRRSVIEGFTPFRGAREVGVSFCSLPRTGSPINVHDIVVWWSACKWYLSTLTGKLRALRRNLRAVKAKGKNGRGTSSESATRTLFGCPIHWQWTGIARVNWLCDQLVNEWDGSIMI